MRKMKKKAQVEVQFNWIYVAVIGAIVLAIFIGIASGIRKSSHVKLSIDAINYFDEIFTSVQSSENTENSILLPGLELEVSSDSDNCNFYTIKGSDLGGRSTEFNPFFSPDLIKKRILSYSLGWDAPFRVNYFLFLTSPDVAYVSVGNQPIFSKLPEHLTKFEVSSYDDFMDQNYYKVRFFSSSPPDYLDGSVKSIKDKDVSAVEINQGDMSLKFYEKDGDSMSLVGESYYVDDTTLLAALYSENIGSYECNMKKAVRRMNRFSLLLKERVGKIQDLASSGELMPLCTAEQYSQAYQLLQELEEATRMNTMDRETFSRIASIKSQLQEINTNINKKSCPTIY